jgi:hypothetical protein
MVAVRVVWSDGQGQNRLFACHSAARDCGEDGRGDLPFVARYGARRSRLSPSLAKERGGRGVPGHHPLSCPLLSIPLPPSPNPSRGHRSPHRDRVQAYPERT